jgi:hypothetical protein
MGTDVSADDGRADGCAEGFEVLGLLELLVGLMRRGRQRGRRRGRHDVVVVVVHLILGPLLRRRVC